MASAVQAATEAVKSAVSTAAATVSSTAVAAANAVTPGAPPTAPHRSGSIGQPSEGEQDSHPLLSPRDELAKEKMEKMFASRPDRQELVDKNILKNSNVAPSLQAKQAELERSQLEDILENKLQARPSPEELVKEGILQQNEVPSA